MPGGGLRGDDVAAPSCPIADLECRAPAYQLASTRCGQPGPITSAILSWSERRKRSQPSSTRAAIWRGAYRYLKHIAALPGQVVCRTGDTITVTRVDDGPCARPRSSRKDHACLGRLPASSQTSEVFLMNWMSEKSLDGRYFGPLPASTIVGRANPLWMVKDH